MLGKHLSNIYDPRKEDAKSKLVYSYAAFHDQNIRDREWQYHMQWVNENIIGPPKATDHYTVDELEHQGMVGIYKAA
jgi:hypothetical protein